jgi:hypothetical protein
MDEDKKKQWDNAKYFLTVFLLLLLAASIGYGTGIRNANDHYEKEIQSNKLVYIHPYGCGELCVNMSYVAEDIAKEANLEFKYIVIDAALEVPGVFIMNSTQMTMLYPFGDEKTLRGIMCLDFMYSGFCSPNNMTIN